MDHVRGAHDVPWDVKSASLEQFLPPWSGVVGFPETAELGCLDRHIGVQ